MVVARQLSLIHLCYRGVMVASLLMLIPSQLVFRLNMPRKLAEGGHHIATDVLRRRTPRSFYNFWNIYRHLADDWFVFDNSASVTTLRFSKRSFEESAEKVQMKFEKFIALKSQMKSKEKK
jgi:predicted ABC-type ATPase